MFRWWAFWRRVQYLAGLFVVLSLVGVGVYYGYYYHEPTCFDTIQNGDEHGVDCSGSCKRICEFEISDPEVLWVQSFKIIDGQYNAVAYIENRNEEIGSPDLKYTFTLYDSQGVIVERSGTTVLPPGGVYPIFEGRIMTGSREPIRSTITFEDGATWLPANVGRDQFTLERRDLSNVDSKPRLTAQVRNNSLTEAKDTEIIATIFNSAGSPLTVARTAVEYFSGRTTENVVFTWPEPIAKTLRSCDIPTDVVLAIDLSGSMNDDGGTPAEPITSVLDAAKSFVSRLNTNDQVSIVTYATGGSLVEPLSNKSATIAEIVAKLVIDAKEERGSTNTGDAIKLMSAELLSSRHNENARKVAILFTDGLANAPGETPEEYAIEMANVLKKQDVDVYTIGLGAKVNKAFLEQIATDKEHAFIAPNVKEVDQIYRTITSSICEDGPTVVEIIAKPQTSFSEITQ